MSRTTDRPLSALELHLMYAFDDNAAERRRAARSAAEKQLRQTSTYTLSISACEEKPFPFLRLPAEIRNRVYEYATAEMKRPLRLYHILPCYDRDSEHSYIGLNTICRQVRAEFRPLFYRNLEVVIHLRDLRPFLRTFFSAAIIKDLPTMDLTVETVGFCISQEEEWDILPLLQAKAINRQQCWFDANCNESSHGFSWQLRAWTSFSGTEEICDSLNKMVNSPPCSFLGDIKSDVFSEIRFCRADERALNGWIWKLVVRKKEGKLNEQEKNRMERYSKELAVLRRVQHTTGNRWLSLALLNHVMDYHFGVQILVTNTRGKLVEKYVCNADISRIEMLKGVVEKKRTQGGRSRRLHW